MKSIIFFFAFFSILIETSAQDEVVSSLENKNYVELGINTLRIASILIDDKPTDFDVWNPYMFTFEAHVKRVNLRFGFGQNHKEFSEIPTVANGKIYVLNDTARTDLRFGLGYEFKLHKRWSVTIGADYFKAKELQSMKTEYVNDNNQTVKTVREISSVENGFEPFIYFHFHLGSRVSLGTELLYRISSVKSKDVDSNNLNDVELVREGEAKKRFVMAPTALFLCARF